MDISQAKGRIEELKEINKSMRRDLNINQGAEEEYGKRAGNQQKKIQEYKSKIGNLEKSLQQIVAEFEKEKEMVRYQHESIIKD